MRDALTDSQDKQKGQINDKGRDILNVMSSENKFYLMLKKLSTNVVYAVFKSKLRSRSIGPFTVVAKKLLAYTLNLPRKLRTHPVFYVGLLKTYRNPSHVNLEALSSRNLALPSAVEFES